VTLAPPASPRRGSSATGALVALLVAGAAVSAGMAALAGGPGSTTGFGPALGGKSSAPVGRTVAAAPVVAPSAVPRTPVALGAPVGPVPAATVGSAYDVGGGGFRPTRLVLPGGRSAPVAAVGLHDDGSLVIPGDPRTVGWWSGGAQAGDRFGSVVVAGHIDTESRGMGVLAVLPTLRARQVVELAAGRRSIRYTVVSARLVPQAQLSRLGSLFRTTGDPQLVLVTCGGTFDPVRHRYADNYVVVARPAT
jgi:hypothetical protein